MSRIPVTYRIQADRSDIERIAEAVALEQSVELPLAAIRDTRVLESAVGRVQQIVERDSGLYDVTILLAEATMAGDVAQTINMLFGNTSLQPHVELLEVGFSSEQARRFGGPRHGIAGLRERLGIKGRPLTCAALKPQGLDPDSLAALASTFALAGIDVIKDDHGLAEQHWAPFSERVRAVQRVLRRAEAERGRPVLYAPSLVGSPRALAEQARISQDEGAGLVLVAPALVGLPAFHELVQEHLRVPVIAHPAYAGSSRVAPPLLLGELFRLLGADAVIFPHQGGRFAYSPSVCSALAEAARKPLHGLRGTLPVPAGGMTVERVPELVAEYGPDSMLLIGGSLLVADDVSVRTRAFVEAVAKSAKSAPDTAEAQQ